MFETTSLSDGLLRPVRDPFIITSVSDDDVTLEDLIFDNFSDLEASERLGLEAEMRMSDIASDLTLMSASRSQEGVGAVLKTIGDAIAEAMRRLIRQISNWIQSLLNWISGLRARSMIRYVQSHISEWESGKKSSKDVRIRVPVPADKIDKIIDVCDREFNVHAEKVADVISDSFSTVIARVNDARTGFGGVKDKIEIAVNLGRIYGRFADMVNIFGKLPHGRKIKEIEDLRASDPTKPIHSIFSRPAQIANIVFYGAESVKTRDITVGTYEKTAGSITRILSTDMHEKVKNFVQSGKVSMDRIQKVLKTMMTFDEVITHIGVSLAADTHKIDIRAKPSNSRSNFKKAMRDGSKLNLLSREFFGFVVGIMLNIEKNYLRQVSASFTIFRRVCKESKKKSK